MTCKTLVVNDKLTPVDRKKLDKLLVDLAEAAAYQFSDKRGEWGIEEALEKEFGVKDVYGHDSAENFDDLDDAMNDSRNEVIDEFVRAFKFGLQALALIREMPKAKLPEEYRARAFDIIKQLDWRKPK